MIQKAKSKKKRCFAAISVQLSFSNFSSYLAKLKQYSKLKEVNDFRMTLAFFGEKNVDEINRISKKLSLIKFRSFVLETAGFGFFPKVIFLKIKKNPELDNLILQFKKEFRADIKPHITLARIKKIYDQRKLKEELVLLKNIKNITYKFEVRKFSLFESILTPNGPLYFVLQNFAAID